MAEPDHSALAEMMKTSEMSSFVLGMLKNIAVQGVYGLFLGKRQPNSKIAKNALKALQSQENYSNPSVYKYWMLLIAPCIAGSLLFYKTPNIIANYATLADTCKPYDKYIDIGSKSMSFLFGLTASLFTIIASAINRTNPTPPQPNCQSQPLQSHPLYPYYKQTTLIEYKPDLFIAQMPFLFEGMSFGTRMAIMPYKSNHSDNKKHCLVYSPIKITDSILQKIDEFGIVIDFICASNSIHHVFVQEWMDQFPDSKVIAPPNLRGKRKDVKFDYFMDIDIDYSFFFDIEMKVTGVPNELEEDPNLDFMVVKTGLFHEEIVVFDRKNKTLVCSDLIENMGHEPETTSSGMLWMLKFAGMAGRPSAPVDLKLMVNKRKYTQCIEKIIEWDFDTVVIAHGRLLENNAKNVFIAANVFYL